MVTSPRERRLWLAAGLSIAAIYASLAFSGAWAAALRETGLLEPAFGAAFLLIILVIVGSGFKRKAGRTEWWVLIGVVVAYGMVAVRLGMSAVERTHLFEYGLVAVLILAALRERADQGRGVRFPALAAATIASLVGAVDEAVQAFVPGRVFDPRDIVFNVVAATLAVAASSALLWGRRKDLGSS